MMYVYHEQAVEAMTKGMSQVFIAIHPAAVVDMKAVQAQMEETIEFLHSLPPMAGSRGVHAPGEGLDRTRAKNREKMCIRDSLPAGGCAHIRAFQSPEDAEGISASAWRREYLSLIHI